MPASARTRGEHGRPVLADDAGTGRRARSPLRIPFIDFARGDGVAVGPGQPDEWTPNIIDETTPWAARYRGLWGLYAQDPISGENAPGGPMYERDGSPRPSWFDPLGFAGLDRVPPPPAEIEALEAECAVLEGRQQELARRVPEETSALQESGVRLQSMRGSPHLAAESLQLEARVGAQAAQLRDMRREHSANEAVLEGLRRRIERRQAGVVDDARAHITQAARARAACGDALQRRGRALGCALDQPSPDRARRPDPRLAGQRLVGGDHPRDRLHRRRVGSPRNASSGR